MSSAAKYVPSAQAQAFLEGVESPRYDRQTINGLAPFFKERAPDEVMSLYSKSELDELAALKGTERDVEARMPVKVTRHYFDLAAKSRPLRLLVKASPGETEDLAGAEDPGFQMDYSPVEGQIGRASCRERV